jgi:hypothetical protein
MNQMLTEHAVHRRVADAKPNPERGAHNARNRIDRDSGLGAYGIAATLVT